MNTNYQSDYKKAYNQKNKIVTIPLSNAFYNELKKRAFVLDIKPNSYAKSIVTAYLNDTVPKTLSQDRKEFIQQYTHISRGIANNINQIALKSNLNETVDVNILINSLQHYEEEFKKFISKV